MRLNVVTMAVVAFDRSTARVESWYRRGFVRLVSIQCDRCGSWVNVSGWDPQAGACDLCAARPMRRKRSAARPKRRRAGGGR
jgi:hypothetical protein